MPGIDELLRAEGEQWRTEIDVRCPMSDTAHGALTRRRPTVRSWRPSRPVLRWSASLAGAAAAVTLLAGLAGLAGLAALVMHGGAGQSGSASSAGGRAATQNAEAAGTSSAAAPGTPAQSAARCPAITLTVSTSSPGAPSAPPRVSAGQLVVVTASSAPSCVPSGQAADRIVTLRLTTSDGRTVTVLRTRLRVVDQAFRVRVALPPTAATGPATVTDDRGHRVRLVITGR